MPTNADPQTASDGVSHAASQESATTELSLADLARRAKADRNRAVDAYRAAAMCAVALGHWLASDIAKDPDGSLRGGNALASAPGLAWVSWLLQVMPLFFVVGGFSSAMSLDAHWARRDGTNQDWIAARLRRMLAPTAALAVTWLVILGAGTAAGVGSLVVQAAIAAAIPLWFLSNYTIDTALAPYVLPRFRANPRRFWCVGLSTFGALELVRFSELTLAGIPVHHIAHLNWVLGWMLFQVAGFAWRDGMLPAGRRLWAGAAGLWVAALLAVFVGPYPTAMVHVPGTVHSPTHPPTVALMLFGAAYSATAIAFAPVVNRYLARHARAWATVVAANGVAMSVYLWHMSAAVGAGAVFFLLDTLPTAAVGTSAWWIQKVPLFGLALVMLGAIVAAVNGIERRALLAPRAPWAGRPVTMFATAAIVSGSLKLWTMGSTASVVIGAAGVALAWHLALSPRTVRQPGTEAAAINQ